jgi:uncharacterized membrane-anchored protein YjiN (DUF445 family)
LKPSPARDEEEKLARLRRMKRLPLVLLGLMVALFFLTLHREEGWAGWIHAFAEAADSAYRDHSAAQG